MEQIRGVDKAVRLAADRMAGMLLAMVGNPSEQVEPTFAEIMEAVGAYEDALEAVAIERDRQCFQRR